MLREVTVGVTGGPTQDPQMEQCRETDVGGRRAQRRPEAEADLFVFLKKLNCSSLLSSPPSPNLELGRRENGEGRIIFSTLRIFTCEVAEQV